MKILTQKDKKNRKQFKFSEHKKLMLKSLRNNTNISKMIRWKSFENLLVFTARSSLSYFSNRCVITGRKKRINKSYSFSRIVFLKLVRSGNINGLKKSSW